MTFFELAFVVFGDRWRRAYDAFQGTFLDLQRPAVPGTAAVSEELRQIATVGLGCRGSDWAMASSPSGVPTRQTAFDYDRTVVAFHGTRKNAAAKLIAGESFGKSTNDDDWLGHGIYFWEFAPQQAWWWAERRYGAANAAVVGALVRLGRCVDLLDPSNADLLEGAHDDLGDTMKAARKAMPKNANNHKYLDCAVFNWLYGRLERAGYGVESCRAVFVPLRLGKMPRLWTRSGVFRDAHIQLCVREPENILAVWPVRKDGRYGQD